MNRFTYSPSPAVAGQPVTICYDVTGATLPVTITVHFDPGGQTAVETISDDDVPPGFTKVCFNVKVPLGCRGAIIVDDSGQSDDCAITVAA